LVEIKLAGVLMRYLVTGSTGQVGSSLKQEIGGEFIGLSRSSAEIESDISNKKVVTEIKEIRPDIIVHTAAMTDLDKAERNLERAREVNVGGTQNIVEAAEQSSSHLIYISTDYIFDGKLGDYTEEDKPNPQSVYANTKYEGERIVRKSDVPTTIFRPSVIFHEDFDNFFTWAKRKLEEESEVKGITDQFCCPTYAPILAEIAAEAAEKTITGTYHAAGSSKVTRYESLQILKEELGLEGTVKRSKMSDLPWKADRPKDSSLSLQKLKRDFETKPISISEAFRRMRA
jgi:dTDP-4-dehydrorhamnose reductase